MDAEKELEYLIIKEKQIRNTMTHESKVFLAFVILGLTMYLFSLIY